MNNSYEELNKFLKTGRHPHKHRVVLHSDKSISSMNSFSYPNHNQSFYLQSGSFSNRRETPTLPNISNSIPQPIQPSFQPYQKFVALPNFYETPRAFIPAESQTNFLKLNAQNKLVNSQSQFFPPLCTQTLPVPSYGMTIQSPYYQSYPSVHYVTDKNGSYPNIRTVIVQQQKVRPNFFYEKNDPRFKKFTID